MSNDTDMRVWVGDLDGYVDIAAISREYEREQRQDALDKELDRIGDIALFAGKSVSSRTLFSRGVNPENWRWAQHVAETFLGHAETKAEIEAAFLKAVIAIGRRHAVARYAHLENLSYSSAITATFPHGIRALLNQYMAGEPTLADPYRRKVVPRIFHSAISAPGLTAYDRAGLVRQSLHQHAIATEGPKGHLRLDRDGMRDMLSLCRLHFTVHECHVRSISEFQALNRRYELARTATARECDQGQAMNGEFIRNWRMRHLHPLTFFFPYSIRNSLSRAVLHATVSRTPPDRTTAVNELALARCGLALMRQKAKGRSTRNE